MLLAQKMSDYNEHEEEGFLRRGGRVTVEQIHSSSFKVALRPAIESPSSSSFLGY